jgi:hypothetical protein
VLRLYSTGGASDFELEGPVLPPSDESQLLETLIQLFERRGKKGIAQVLKDTPFSLCHAKNQFGDEFYALHAGLDIDDYERVRALVELPDGPKVFASISDALSELNYGVRHIAVELTLQPTSSRVGQPTDLRPKRREPTFWTPGLFRLFISHCSSVKADATALQQALDWFGISGFVAHVDIEPSREWQEEIELALETMDSLAAMLTNDYSSSSWCDQEVGVALGRGCLVVPINVDRDPYGFIGRTQAVPGSRGTYQFDTAQRVAQSLLRQRATSEKYSRALVPALENAPSFAVAKSLVGMLEQCKITQSEAERLVAAIASNSQVGNAFGVPDRIRNLVVTLGYSDLVKRPEV